MAEVQRMTAADVVGKVMAGEHGDFVREAVAVAALSDKSIGPTSSRARAALARAHSARR